MIFSSHPSSSNEKYLWFHCCIHILTMQIWNLISDHRRNPSLFVPLCGAMLFKCYVVAMRICTYVRFFNRHTKLQEKWVINLHRNDIKNVSQIKNSLRVCSNRQLGRLQKYLQEKTIESGAWPRNSPESAMSYNESKSIKIN